MRTAFFAINLLVFCGFACAQSAVWQPSAGHTQIALWPGAIPDAQPSTGPETVKTDSTDLVAGKPWTYINNVSRPTITVYSPEKNNTGVGVVVFPGGGYQILAIDLEGTEVCDWLTAHGITCVLLKYRVPGEGKYPKSGSYPYSPMALEDAQRALRMVRYNAAKWHIDPHKIGVLGFSAGGSLVADISNHFAERVYPAVDAIDKVSCRPDFAAAIYPGHLSLASAMADSQTGLHHDPVGKSYDASLNDPYLELNPNLHPTRDTPPTFLVQAEDDHVDGVDQSLAYYMGLKDAGVPTEMLLYARGGHAFGLRPTSLPITHWPERMETWLHSIGMLP